MRLAPKRLALNLETLRRLEVGDLSHLQAAALPVTAILGCGAVEPTKDQACACLQTIGCVTTSSPA